MACAADGVAPPPVVALENPGLVDRDADSAGESDAFVLAVGQQKHRFTHDRNVSSRYINNLKRSMVTNMFAADYTPAVTVPGGKQRWNWYGGVFANKTSRDMEDAFTNPDSGYSLLATVTRDIGDHMPPDSALLSVSFVHSDANENPTRLEHSERGLASAPIQSEGPYSRVTKITAGLDRGDHCQAGYMGLNFHLAQHRVKLMTGIEYATPGGADCWTGSLAVRFFRGPHSGGPFPMAQVLDPAFD